MSFDSRPKDNPLNWSFRIGELFGITIRLHLFFIFGAFIILALAFKDAEESAGLTSVVDSLGTIAILFLIVLVHEFGHCWGARRSGGEADEILLWPLGGLATVRPRHTPRSHFVTTVSGPAVNVILCAVTAVALVVLHGGIGAVPWYPLNTFNPIDLTVGPSELQKWLRIVFGLSYVILLFNLMPVYPFDGGRLLHCYLWPRKGYREATMTATFVGMVGAIALGVAGLLTGGMLLLTIAVFGYITCFTDRRATKLAILEGDQGGEFGYDFSQGHTSFEQAFEEVEEKKPGYFERRRRAKEEARRLREAEALEQHRQRVDEILLKVHRHGMGSLSAEETHILQKETERQRAEGG